MASTADLLQVVDAAWADALGCDVCELSISGTSGTHVVPGLDRVYMARVGAATVVMCPAALAERAAAVVDGLSATAAFTRVVCARIAGVDEPAVLGPSCHHFVDTDHFAPVAGGGERIDPGDHRLAELRAACGDEDWFEGGFFDDPATYDGVVYAIDDEDSRLVAAGNMTPYRGVPADVGLVTRPDARGRGLGAALTSTMVADALPHVGVVRYRALLTNEPSRRIARSLGFVERGQNMVVRL